MNGAPEGIRTPNLLIRSQMLYPLSYRRIIEFVVLGGAGVNLTCLAPMPQTAVLSRN